MHTTIDKVRSEPQHDLTGKICGGGGSLRGAGAFFGSCFTRGENSYFSKGEKRGSHSQNVKSVGGKRE